MHKGGSSPGGGNLACGDVDGDGYPDVVIGNPQGTFMDDTGIGRVYVVRGMSVMNSSVPLTVTLPVSAGVILEGIDSVDLFGHSVAVADVDQDGRGDLIIGAPQASSSDNPYHRPGEVYLWRGRALSGQRFVIDSQAEWTIQGANISDNLGSEVATGDFDGDTYPEVLIGCSGCVLEGPPSYLYGKTSIVEPLQISGRVTVTTVANQEILGSTNARCMSPVGAGDLNGDKVDDIIVAAPCSYYPNRNLPGSVHIISYPRFKTFLPSVSR